MAVAERKKRELESRREFILRESRQKFLEKGYDGVTIQDICKAVEYGKSAIYALFKSKEEIFGHIKLEGLTLLAERYEALKWQNPDQGFLECARILFEFSCGERAYYRLIFMARQEEAESFSPELREKIDVMIARVAAPLSRVLREGIESETYKQVEIPLVVRLIWSSLVGVINGYLTHGENPTSEMVWQACELHTSLYINGLKQEC